MKGKAFEEKENGLYIIKDGEITELKPPGGDGYGSDEIVWQEGRVVDVVRTNRIRLNGKKKI
ncbi:DUF3954 domain-containing protein [Jeotgalibacillus terrae]|uniref:DUF3954 domain-containing protein n=1 Tax=Jeotgalibacillus terrae TaxID=587735 RepID=A0ABW5ZEL6_9BACL|nr:DUF3954 domain-containing protein [Jeotgalibacillus terrae]MBM7580024.1 hypothetical protein [Jeotgalibacillus terrae]